MYALGKVVRVWKAYTREQVRDMSDLLFHYPCGRLSHDRMTAASFSSVIVVALAKTHDLRVWRIVRKEV